MKIKKSFEDPLYITESIEKSEKKVFDKPKVKKSELDDDDDEAFEQDQFYEEWKIDYAEYKKESKTFDANMAKAYAMIWKNYCAKEV